ncbi:hypothetical protein APY04_1960 [Hyphomicrobium sulfonivorans]|uniref:Uncharacterized protein n=1 Tax=Hyphomicrobium sulfonivorans TaxID=121290 RepID=A0A120CV79_HYPSL|nr:hypothetical protein APY04_1960 [Hyphomicrobium sulfonivorans]
MKHEAAQGLLSFALASRAQCCKSTAPAAIYVLENRFPPQRKRFRLPL